MGLGRILRRRHHPRVDSKWVPFSLNLRSIELVDFIASDFFGPQVFA